MQAISCEALPLTANPKGVTKWAFIYVKRAKAKNSVISYLGVSRVGNDKCKQCQASLYPDSNPKRGNTKMRNKIDINLCKSTKAKKQCHSLPYSVLRVRNDQLMQAFKVWFYL